MSEPSSYGCDLSSFAICSSLFYSRHCLAFNAAAYTWISAFFQCQELFFSPFSFTFLVERFCLGCVFAVDSYSAANLLCAYFSCIFLFHSSPNLFRYMQKLNVSLYSSVRNNITCSTDFPASFFFCSCLNLFRYVLHLRKFNVSHQQLYLTIVRAFRCVIILLVVYVFPHSFFSIVQISSATSCSYFAWTFISV